MIEPKVRAFLEESLTRGFPKLIGMKLTEISEGHARIDIEIDERHENIYHRIHGGVLFSIADTTGGFAARSTGIQLVTSGSSFDYLRSAHEGSKYIYCVADTVKRGKTLIVMDTRVYDDQDTLLCKGSFTYCVIHI